MGEQIARREPPLSETGGTVHVVASQELRRGALDRRCRCPLPVRGRPRHHRLALGERVLPLGQPARSSQLDAHPPRIGDLGRPGRSEHEARRARARRGRARPPGRARRRATARCRPHSACDRASRARSPRARHPHLDARRHELALALLDLAATRGELPQHLRRELLDLRHPVAHRAPPHPRQTFTHSRTQMRLVEEAGRLGVLVDRRGIKRRPPPISAARHVRGHDVGVQLRVLGATHPMAIRRRHEPRPRLVADTAAAAAHPTRLALQIAQRRVDRRLVRLHQRPGQRRLADREQHAHRLRRRERQIKRRHLRAPTDALQALTRPWVATVHERHEAVVVNPAAEPEGLGPATGPAARRLAATGVVVIAALRDLALVIARLLDRQLADRQHRRVVPRLRRPERRQPHRRL